MNFKNLKNQFHFVCVVLLFLIANPASSQNHDQIFFDSILPYHYTGMQVQIGLMPGGSITTKTGNYYLHSKLQSCFSAAFVYQLNLDYKWNMNYGLQLNVISTNYYLHIPDVDLNGYPNTQGAPQIEDKQAYFKIALPVLLSYNFLLDKKGFYAVRTGIKFNYSGLSIDERVGFLMADSTGQLTQIFSGDFTSNNHNKPWLSYIGGVSKTLFLKNKALFSIDVFAEISTTDFIKGNYQITVPNKPVTEGRYAVNGSCVGISFQYLFPRRRRFYK